MSELHSVDTDRWSKMSIFEQMGNIYSELGRSFAAKSRGDVRAADFAMRRCLDLFNTTVMALTAKHSVKAKEVLRARDQYLQLFCAENPDKEEIKSLDKYFFNFAKAARLRRT